MTIKDLSRGTGTDGNTSNQEVKTEASDLDTVTQMEREKGQRGSGGEKRFGFIVSKGA
jgi:hypothetical protein